MAVRFLSQEIPGQWIVVNRARNEEQDALFKRHR